MLLPKSSPTLLCKSYQVYRSGAFVLGIFFPQRVHPAVLVITDVWKAVVIYALMSFILLEPDAISSVPVPSLSSFLFIAIPSFVGIRTSFLQFLRGNLERCSLSSPFTLKPCPVSADYRCYYWKLSSMYL